MSPYSVAERWLRIGAGFALFSSGALLLIPLFVLLLPWRGLRVRLGVAWVRIIFPTIVRVLGVELDDQASPALRAAAPAIFVLNHTSSLDTVLSFALMPPGCCGIAKKEALWIPVFGQAYWLSGHLLLDRGDRERAVSSMARLAGVVAKHRLNIWLGPEGTRSPDGRLGPFKKGFVHLALATRLPVVPLVLEGAHRIWPPRTFDLAPGRVVARALPPIPTTEWDAEHIDEQVAQVRQAYLDALPPEHLPLSP